MDDYYSQKRWTIIIHKHGIYEVSQRVAERLETQKLGKIRKVSKLHRMII